MDPTLFKQQLEELADIRYDEDTGGFVIKKLKPQNYDCDRCHDQVSTTLCHITKVGADIKHWRHHCKACKNYLHPVTLEPLGGQLSSAAGRILGIVRRELKQSKGRTHADMTIDNASPPIEEIESETGIITRWK